MNKTIILGLGFVLKEWEIKVGTSNLIKTAERNEPEETPDQSGTEEISYG